MGLFSGFRQSVKTNIIELEFLEVVQAKGLDYDLAREAIAEAQAGGFVSRVALVSTYREMEMKREARKNDGKWGNHA